jgi:non-ribosomal peptide synthetase component F
LPVKVIALPDSPTAVDDYLSNALHVRLDLHSAPCGDAALLQLAGGRGWVLLLTFHHSVIDGWSAGLLLKELTACYNELLAARWQPAAGFASACSIGCEVLPALPVQYADYAAWQQQRLSAADSQQMLSYWMQQLTGAPELLQLPTDRPRPALKSNKGDYIEFSLTQKTVDQLHAFASGHGTTPFVSLLAAYRLLLARMSNQNDIVVGAAYQNRPTGDC